MIKNVPGERNRRIGPPKLTYGETLIGSYMELLHEKQLPHCVKVQSTECGEHMVIVRQMPLKLLSRGSRVAIVVTLAHVQSKDTNVHHPVCAHQLLWARCEFYNAQMSEVPARHRVT